MAICGRCAREIASPDVCLSCRADRLATPATSPIRWPGTDGRLLVAANPDQADGPANLPVAAHPDRASCVSDTAAPPRRYSAAQLYAQAHRYWPMEPECSPADPGWRLLHRQAGAEASALLQFERANPVSHPLSATPTAEPRSGRWIAILAATATLCVVAAVATVLVARYHPPAADARRADKPGAAAAASSPPATVASTPQNRLSVDNVAVAAPDGAAVSASLNHYFDAINRHDYSVYRRLFIPALRRGLSPASFNSEFGGTGAVAEQLHSITVIGAGEVEATVTFISRQLTATTANSTCTAWSVDFYLGWRGYRYLLAAPPRWYQASYHSCT